MVEGEKEEGVHYKLFSGEGGVYQDKRRVQLSA